MKIENFPYKLPHTISSIQFGTLKILMTLFEKDAVVYVSDDTDYHVRILEELRALASEGTIFLCQTGSQNKCPTFLVANVDLQKITI